MSQLSRKLSVNSKPWAQNAQGSVVSVIIEANEEQLELHWQLKNDSPFAKPRSTNGEVYKDKCLEFFFVPNKRETRYLNLEVNCLGVPHFAFGPNREQRKFVSSQYLKEQTFASTLSLGFIPEQENSIRKDWEMNWKLNLKDLSKELEIDFRPEEWHGNLQICGGSGWQQYQTCFPIKTKTPDFHRPEFFQKIFG